MEKVIKKIEENKVILMGLILIIGLVLLFMSIPEKKTKLSDVEIFRHREEGIVKEEEYKGIKLTNIKMVTEGEYTTFSATATNVSDSDINIENFYIELKDKNGSSVAKLLGYIPDGLKKGEVKQIRSTAKGSFKSAYTKEIVDYTVKKE